jgi:hypothetical protein
MAPSIATNSTRLLPWHDKARKSSTNPTHKKKKEEEEEEEKKLGCSSPSSIASMPKVTSSLT